MNKIEQYISIVPNERQKIVQEMKFYAFIHFSVNTFTGKEWGNGKESPSIFNPTKLDTDAWCKAIKGAEMKGVILTCKHHDGFCLWQTDSTEHSIKNSPYKNGKGDIVKELSESCKKFGLKFGVYLSPWDRNSELYSTDKYMDFYIHQLTELLSNYGDIFMLWLDGACGSKMDGKPAQKYDFDRIYTTALKLQPQICMSGCAPDIRWVGNESGIARESEWNVVPKFDYALQNIAANCQGDDDFKKFQKRCHDVMMKDMGSREFLKNFNEFMWYPSEVDVSIRLGWFYHKSQYFTVRSINNLMNIYYNSVGGNSLLLLNIPPDKNGLFCQKDVNRLKTMGELLRLEKSLAFKAKSIIFDKPSKPDFDISNLLTEKTFSPKDVNQSYKINLKFDIQTIDRVSLAEDTDFSQRVEKFQILTLKDGKEQVIFNGTIIGFSKIAVFKPIETDNLIINVLECRKEPYINDITIFKVGAYRVSNFKKFSIFDKIIKMFQIIKE